MRLRVSLGAGIAVLLALAGCASHRPCPVIPMQLKLAKHELDSYQKQVTTKEAALERETNGLSMAETRLRQLEEEEQQLKALIESGKSDATKKEERP